MTQYTTLRRAAPQISLMAVMIFLSMYSRMVMSPLLVFIQEALAVGPAAATRLFLPQSVAYSGAMVLSGFLAGSVGHRRTIAASGAVLGIGLIVVAVGNSLAVMHLGFGMIGAGAGLYPPSGVASLTGMVHPDIRGKAIAIHEVGPNSAFVIAPLIVAAGVYLGNWRWVPGLSGVAAIVMAVTFDRTSVAGGVKAERPQLDNLKQLFTKPEFWAITVFFSVAASSTVGVFSILPTFLIGTEGYPVGVANSVISISRISGIGMLFVSGILVDRIGVRRLIGGVLAITGVLTVGIGALTGNAMLAAVALQPIIIAAFFPAAVSAIADIGPPEMRGIAVSFMIPMVNIIASGVFPTLMGFLTERDLVRAGFVGLGVVMLTTLILLPMLPDHRPAPVAPTPPDPARSRAPHQRSTSSPS
ncbi:MAG: MFS transporter [Alkalispirochaeta sp.]